MAPLDRPTSREALGLYLAMLAGNEPPGGYLELRLKARGRGMRRLGFYPTSNRTAIMAAIEGRARAGDIFIGVAPRRGTPDGRPPRSGGIDAIARTWVLHVDADTPAACAALRAFQPEPTCIISTGRGRQGYWALEEPLRPDHARRANRRLALAIGADMNATDAARILRPPGTKNWKYRPGRPVVCEQFKIVRYTAREIVGGLPDPPVPPVPCAPRLAPRSDTSRPSAGLDALARTVAHAQSPSPGRNNILYWAACRAQEDILAGELDPVDARQALRTAALSTGLGEHEVEATLSSALDRKVAA